MASRSSSAGRRAASGAANGGRQSGRPPSGKSKHVTPDLLSKEEEYMRLNAELEEKTASLIKEAEEVMQDQDDIFSKPSTYEVNYNEQDLEDFLAQSLTSESKSQPKQKPKSSQGRPSSQAKKSRPKSKTAMAPGHASPDVPGMLQERIALASTISTLEDDSRDGSYSSTVEDKVLPLGAEDMGTEATIRFLKAKLRVMQEELDRVTTECSLKDEKVTAAESKLKELTDDQSRLQKTNGSLQNQIDKYKKLYDEMKNKNEGMEQQLASLRKDLDGLQRNQKQAASSKNATEVRLNRALEEAEKYKTALQKAKGASKDSSEQERKRIEQLMLENKRLEKQKNELMVGFKKQMKLIDVLKRQKMHIEAAKLLQFSEEEFVKGLDWGS